MKSVSMLHVTNQERMWILLYSNQFLLFISKNIITVYKVQISDN